MPPKRKTADPPRQAPLDDNGLTDQYRLGILAALPPDVVPPEQFWCDLETAVAAFIALQQHRSELPSKRKLERWQNIDRLVSELGNELRAMRRTRWSVYDFDPLWQNRALAALWPVKRKAEAGMIGYATISGAFSRRGNPHRAYLYGAVCDLWRWHLGQKLAYSRADRGIPYGPLIRFFTACVGPILGDEMLSAHGVGAAIEREQNRLSYFFGRQK